MGTTTMLPAVSGAPRRRDALPEYVQSLLRAEAYPHPADDLRLHETHISWVVLAGPYAYKLKKPVDFGFLDFSTLERRAAACADEVRLNRRLSPDIYLGVVQIVERDGAYAVGGPGRPVEPAVWMRRLPDEGMLPRLLARSAVRPSLVRRIARDLARFHTVAASGPGIDEYGSPAVVRSNWQENFDQVRPFVGRTLPADRERAIRASVERFLDRNADLLERRVAEGRIREGHGDLHGASICVERGRPRFFDCLEFNARFRCADVAAEVAFLAMDLDHHGRADLADAFVEAYVRVSGDSELLDLLDFYKCYRAFVRGKVLSLRLAEPGLTSEEEQGVAADARAYFDLAWTAAGGLDRRIMVVVMGRPASGKTSVARALASRFGLVHLSSDLVRKELAGLEPTEHAVDGPGRGLYTPSLTRRTYAIMRRRAAYWLRRGRSVVLDATYGRPAERAAALRLAHRLEARPVVFVCRADESVLVARLAGRADDPNNVSDARPELWPALRSAFREPTELSDSIYLDTGVPPDQAAERATATLCQLMGCLS